MGRELVHGEVLEQDTPRGQLHRPESGLVAARHVLVDVGTSEPHDQRCPLVTTVEALDRRGAAAGVESHQQVTALVPVRLVDDHLMAQLTEEPSPAQGGGAVSLP